MGADVETAITDLQRQRARKSILSGSGYGGGKRVTVGASQKGRIWSHRRDRVDQLVQWYKRTGAKLIDTTIDPDQVLNGTLNAQTITQRPAKVPIAVDWPEEMYKSPEATSSLLIDENERLLSELDIEVVNPGASGDLRFVILSETQRAEFELELFEDEGIPNYRFVARDTSTVYVRSGGSMRSISSFFYENPPPIWFADGSSLEGNQYVELKILHPPYRAETIQVWDWTGVNLRKESQGRGKDETSIQARVIRELKQRGYELIVDDDGKGEAADVVAMRIVGNTPASSKIEVEFYHCKFSREATPGRRIEDLYELCGQAQKSISWMLSPEKRTDLFTHLLRREAARQEAGGRSRLEVGDSERLRTVREMSHLCEVTLKIFIVQPGVSKANVSRQQLLLMSVTENYLFETYQIPFTVITSP